MKTKVEISDNSVETAGLPTHYSEAIIEFVWNSYDAGATSVDICFDSKNPIANLLDFSIEDDGEGIDYSKLDLTFGKFLDSQKRKIHQRTSFVHGKRGKGRYSFEIFSGRAIWHTSYFDEKKNEIRSYSISIDSTTKDYYERPDEKGITKSQSNKTGTKVIFEMIHSLNANHLNSDEFTLALSKEFGWFLHLNKSNKFSLKINGKPIPYEQIIADSEMSIFQHKDTSGNKFEFRINYVRWSTKIGEKCFFYFLDADQVEHAKKHTSFNNKSDEFHHSVYVESPYFLNFRLSDDDENQKTLIGKNQTDEVYRALYKELISILEKKRKDFLRGDSEKIVSRFEREGVMPEFKNNKYDQTRKEDFNQFVRELYSAEPKIFLDLGREQRKTMLGMINIVLDSNERDSMLGIIDNVVKLTKEEREQLALILKKTTLKKITEMLRLVERRYKAIEVLQMLVHDLVKFSTERDHIQLAVEENYWLFGEEFHLVSADKTFEKALEQYLYIIDGESHQGEISGTKNGNRRPDIFMCRKRTLPDPRASEGQIEESVIVELKAPRVILTVKEFRQVQDYMNYVISLPQYNGQSLAWKFFLVGTSCDQDLQRQVNATSANSKRGLAYKDDKYEIFVYTWSDIFRNFDIRHKYLLEKLEFDRGAISIELEELGIPLGRELSDALVAEVIKK